MLRWGSGGYAAVLAVLAACGERPPVPATPEAPSELRPPARAQLAALGDWPSYNRDPAATRFAPLAELTPSNVASLVEAWRYDLPRRAAEGAPRHAYELTPLAVGGVLYIAAAGHVAAIAGDSGRELWRRRLDGASPSHRGVAYWIGDAGQRPRLFFTAGRRLIALDAQTGEPVPGFGTAGAVDMEVLFAPPPTRFEDLLIVGSDTRPGSVRAFDARTGALVWVFDSARRPGARSDGTLDGGDAGGRPSPLHPARAVTVDVDRALVYAALGGRDPHEPFAPEAGASAPLGSAVVALDARTGLPRWIFQTVHDDRWGYGPAAPPALLDLRISGRSVPALVQTTAQGYLFVLNRVTGEPVLPVAERPVPASEVPGEQRPATQPVPVRPPPLARTALDAADLVTAANTTEAHAELCRALTESAGEPVNRGPFTPFAYRAPEGPPRSTLIFPGTSGAAGWGGVAVHPDLGYVFVNTMDVGTLGWIEPVAGPPAAAEGRAAPAYRLAHAAPFWWEGPGSQGTIGWPCQKPPWGRLLAVDLRSGDIAWQVPLGVTAELPARRQRTGRPSMGGPIATAGGLVLIGATDDRRFRAFAARSGEQLWTAELELAAHAVPITYLGADGKQYVAIVAGGTAADLDGAAEPALVAYSLP